MDKICRRKFLEKSLLLNGSMILGSTWLSPFLDEIFLPSAVDYYLPIQADNPSIVRNEKKCKGCRDCVIACTDKQKVFGTYPSSKTHHVCINCGTCVSSCRYGALSERSQWKEVLNAIDDPSKTVIVSISPSVPAGIGDYFGMPAGSYLSENIIGACRAIGFDHVLDTNFSADLTVMEEAHELQNRIMKGGDLPQFTSCCPAWVKYVEIYYPSLVKHLSTTRSPNIMQGTLVKSYFAKRKGIDPRNIFHVAVTPCTAKKYEITREELKSDGIPVIDISLTTNELAMMLKSRKIELANQTGKYDTLMGSASGGGIIFGNSGGVMRAAIRTVHYNITGKNPSADLLDLKQIQGLNGLKEAAVKIGNVSLNVAVCYEMRNAKPLLDQVMSGSCKYDFIEVMACPGGCVAGAGQHANSKIIEKRLMALNAADEEAATRFSHENPEIKLLYKKFLGKVGSKKAEYYLHTTYNNKSLLLNPALVEEPAAI
jgi:ferredoxin hydrogenase